MDKEETKSWMIGILTQFDKAFPDRDTHFLLMVASPEGTQTVVCSGECKAIFADAFRDAPDVSEAITDRDQTQ